jgi:hypothetical protein
VIFPSCLGRERLVRYASINAGILIACAALTAMGLPAPAVAAKPIVTFRAAAVPVPIDLNNPRHRTYPGTGYVLGASAALESEWKIRGSEYGGSPSPLTWLKVYSPAGLRLDPQAFGICSTSILMADGPRGCPRRSLAGPVGEGTGVVTFGNTRVPERADVHVFFRPGGLIFYVHGGTPALIEMMSLGTILPTAAPFAQLFTGEVPLVATVPEGQYASLESLKITLGAAFKRAGKLVSWVTLPSHCPARGFMVRAELSFLNGETVPVADTVKCPKRRPARK